MISQKRKKTAVKSNKNNKNIIFRVLKGSVLGLVFTVLAVLIIALVIKKSDISDEMISAFNQIIKIISIFIASYAAVKGLTEQYVLHGTLAGCIYVVLGFLIFSLIEGKFGDIKLLLLDIVMGSVIGMITSIIFGKLLNNKKTSSSDRLTKKAY